LLIMENMILYKKRRNLINVEYKNVTKYIFSKPNHIADGLTAISDLGFQRVDYFVEHSLLQNYKIDLDVIHGLFWAMKQAYERELIRMADLNEKKIIEFLESNNKTMQ